MSRIIVLEDTHQIDLWWSGFETNSLKQEICSNTMCLVMSTETLNMAIMTENMSNCLVIAATIMATDNKISRF